MSSRPEDEPVEPEIVDGPPPARAPAPRRSFFHPLSGAIILGVDWLAFGLDLFSDFAALLVVGVLAFAATYYLVYRTQVGLRGDSPSSARWKAFIGALAAGVPFPVTGTIVGAAILTLSGLPSSFPSRKT
jgi:hypothetical protein